MAELQHFERAVPIRSTVARKCREFYLRRLERTETLQRRWSLCTKTTEESTDQLNDGFDSSATSEFTESVLSGKCSVLSGQCSGIDFGGSFDPSAEVDSDFSESFRKSSGENSDSSDSPLPGFPKRSRSTFDLAMDNLRKEITSLIAQDNNLFRQLLSLNDSIAELRAQQEMTLSQWDMDSDSEEASLESLSDAETTSTVSPASTLSSCCSSHHLNSANSSIFVNRRPVLPSDGKRQRPLSALYCTTTPSDGKRQRPLSALYCTTSPSDGGKQRSRSTLCCTSTPSDGLNGKQRSRSAICRTTTPSDGANGKQRTRSALCLRCHGKGVTPLYRRAESFLQLAWPSCKDEFDSYDSGIHIHSDSDHEIFV